MSGQLNGCCKYESVPPHNTLLLYPQKLPEVFYANLYYTHTYIILIS